MANKPRKVPNELLEEVYTALGLVLLQQPTGAGPTDVWEALFKDTRDPTSISRAICELERNGYVIFVGWRDKRKKYCLTNKEFILSPAMALNGSSTTKTNLRGQAPHGGKYCLKSKPSESPADPEYWLSNLNAVVGALCVLQDHIPSLKAGLLDLTKNLERLSKVKEIVGDVAKVARRNV